MRALGIAALVAAILAVSSVTVAVVVDEGTMRIVQGYEVAAIGTACCD